MNFFICKGMIGIAGMFKNGKGEVRSGWKIILLYLISFAGMVIIGFWLGAISVFTPIKNLNDIMEFGQEVSEIGAVLIMVYLFEKSRMRHFGFPIKIRVTREVAYGIGFGALSMILIFFLFQAAGLATLKTPLSHPHWSPVLIWMLALMILVGAGEEMLTRGYTMTLLQRQIGNKWLSIGVSSAIFAALHLMNPHVSVLAFINLLLYAVVAAYMYIRSGSLWMPIAYHATWDYFEGNIFGFPNSGNEMSSLYSFSHVTPNILTGGGFGPEGGLIVTALLFITLLWTLKIYRPTQTINWQDAIIIQDDEYN